MRAAFVGVAVLFGATAAALAAPPLSPKVEQQRREAKARHDKAVAEMKRKHDQQGKQMRSQQAGSNQKLLQDMQQKTAARRPSPQLPTFNAAAAPPPAECLRAFVAAAKSASSMQQVLPFLPAVEAAALVDLQKRHDPKQAAEGRAWHRQQNPKISAESLTYLSNPPFVNELDRNRQIAKKILDVLSVKTEGNEAHLRVSTYSDTTIINNGRYPYGTARIDMIGEGNYWKLEAYNDNDVYYQEPPRK